MENLAQKSDAELQSLMNMSQAELQAMEEHTRQMHAEAQKILAERKRLQIWAGSLVYFAETLLTEITKAQARPEAERAEPWQVSLYRHPHPEDFFYMTPGYQQVIHAICRKYAVGVKFRHSAEWSNNWGTTDAYTTLTITFGQPTGSKAEDDVIKKLLRQIAKA